MSDVSSDCFLIYCLKSRCLTILDGCQVLLGCAYVSYKILGAFARSSYGCQGLVSLYLQIRNSHLPGEIPSSIHTPLLSIYIGCHKGQIEYREHFQTNASPSSCRQKADRQKTSFNSETDHNSEKKIKQVKIPITRKICFL